MIKLAEVLPQTSITTLECAAPLIVRYGPLFPPVLLETRPGRPCDTARYIPTLFHIHFLRVQSF